jgi:hypothetical protein
MKKLNEGMHTTFFVISLSLRALSAGCRSAFSSTLLPAMLSTRKIQILQSVEMFIVFQTIREAGNHYLNAGP